MPYYSVRRKSSDEILDLPMMSWNDLQKFLNENQEYEVAPTHPAFVKVN
jgi:hypothetical protein